MAQNEISEFVSPKLYDLFNESYTSDIRFYIDYCKENKITELLELGIGTGRVAIPLAEAGIEVWGIDNSERMLNELNEKIKRLCVSNIKPFSQDMRSIHLGRAFDLVIVPFCTFNFLLSIDDQKKTLLCIKKHLTKNGIIIFDLLSLYTFSYTKWNNEYYPYHSAYNGYESFNISIMNDFDQSTQILSQTRKYEITSPGDCNEIKVIMKNRVFLLGEFKLLLESCGFRITDLFGNYNGESYGPDSSSMIVFAQIDEVSK